MVIIMLQGRDLLKKFYAVALLILIFFLAGCGSDNLNKKKDYDKQESEKLLLLQNSFWVQEYESLGYLIDALQRQDNDYLKQLMIEKKVFFVDKDTNVIGNAVATDSNIEMILFKEGRYTNKEGITLRKFLVNNAELQQRRNEAINFIIDSFNESQKNISDLTADNIEVTKQIESNLGAICSKIYSLSNNFYYDSDTREMAGKAGEIISEFENSVSWINSALELKKYLEESEYDWFDSEKNAMVQFDIDNSIESVEKAKQLRENFKAEYGF